MPDRATLLSVKPTAVGQDNAKMLAVQFQREGAPPESGHWMLSESLLDRMTPGTVVPVRVDPGDPGVVVLDAVAFRQSPPDAMLRTCHYCAGLYPIAERRCPDCGAPLRATG